MIKNYREPRSSFMSVEKDLTIITDQMLKDKRLTKLLYYTGREVLSTKPEFKKLYPDLTEQQLVELLGNNIKSNNIVSKLRIFCVGNKIIKTNDNIC